MAGGGGLHTGKGKCIACFVKPYTDNVKINSVSLVLTCLNNVYMNTYTQEVGPPLSKIGLNCEIKRAETHS